MSTAWDRSVDVIAVGSGGGGMLAALTTAENGGEALVVEKRELLGGSTAMSGGVIWLPDNPVMRADGIKDSEADGLAYLDSVVGDVGPASSAQRRLAFLRGGHAMIQYLLDQGVQLVRCPGYADYYDTAPGGNAEGRSLEMKPLPVRDVGPVAGRVQPGMAVGLGLAVMTNEVREVQYVNRSVRSFLIAARVYARTKTAAWTKQPVLTNGTALIARLARLAQDRGIEMWTESPFEDFVVEDGRVVGIRVIRNGRPQLIEARKGVVVAAGGFAHNPEMRRQYGGDYVPSGQWSMANPGDTGDAIRAAVKLGARTALEDQAVWLPGPAREFGMTSLQAARNRPGTIMVDSGGRRFCNEANSYVEVGRAMFERDKTTPAIPAWLIFDEGYRKRFSHQRTLIPGKIPAQWLDSGLLKKADTLAELASICEIDADGLAETVRNFNLHAVHGKDPEYGRGESRYNDCLGDPGSRTNASVGPVAKGPFYAFQVFPGDVGTAGGLLADEHGRVVGADDQVIPGLYATGNGVASVTGRHYLGAGSSIAHTMVFGYLAARHAMDKEFRA